MIDERVRVERQPDDVFASETPDVWYSVQVLANGWEEVLRAGSLRHAEEVANMIRRCIADAVAESRENETKGGGR